MSTYLKSSTDKLWEQYFLDADNPENFWEKYTHLIQQARQKRKNLTTPASITMTGSLAFPKVLKLSPRQKTTYWKKVRSHYSYSFLVYMLFAFLLIFSMAHVLNSLDQVGIFMTYALFFISLPTFIYYFLSRQLAHTQLYIKADEIIRKGKGLNVKRIKIANIISFDSDKLGLTIGYYQIEADGLIVKSILQVPGEIANDTGLQAYLGEVIEKKQQSGKN